MLIRSLVRLPQLLITVLAICIVIYLSEIYDDNRQTEKNASGQTERSTVDDSAPSEEVDVTAEDAVGRREEVLASSGQQAEQCGDEQGRGHVIEDTQTQSTRSVCEHDLVSDAQSDSPTTSKIETEQLHVVSTHLHFRFINSTQEGLRSIVMLYVCLSVCPSSARIYPNRHGQTGKNFVLVACGRGSGLLRRRCDTLCASGSWMTSCFHTNGLRGALCVFLRGETKFCSTMKISRCTS